MLGIWIIYSISDADVPMLWRLGSLLLPPQAPLPPWRPQLCYVFGFRMSNSGKLARQTHTGTPGAKPSQTAEWTETDSDREHGNIHYLG